MVAYAGYLPLGDGPEFYQQVLTGSLADGLVRDDGEWSLFEQPAALVGTLTHVGSTVHATHAHAGYLIPSWADDLFGHIIIRPATLDAGYVASEQVFTFEVANLFLTPQTWSGLANNAGDGLTINGLPTFPHTILSFGNFVFTVNVTVDGPPVITGTLDFDFGTSEDVSIPISGTRVVAFPFAPDWKPGIRERLAWATDVLVSASAAEQRRALRLSPRRVFSVQLIIDGRERSFFDLMMHSWSGRNWAMPVWPDIQRLASAISLGATSIPCSTPGRDFRVGGLAILRGDSAFAFETVEIAAVAAGSLTLVRPTQAAWPVRTRLYPARIAQLVAEPKSKRKTDRAILVDAEFKVLEANDWTPASLSTYRGFPLYVNRPDESEDLSLTLDRFMNEIDNVTGIPFTYDTADIGLSMQDHAWKMYGISERDAFRAFLYLLRGRQVACWIPTHADDLTLTQTLASSATVMSVENVGYTRFSLDQPCRRDIRISLKNGTAFNRRIVGGSIVNENTENLTIDASLGVTIAPADVARISFLVLARLESDEVEINHITDVEGLATARVMFRGVRDDDL